MRQLRITTALAVVFVVGCVASVGTVQQQGEALGSRPYYVTKVAYSFSDSTADAVRLHLDDRLVVWLGGWLQGARREGLEPAACLRVAKRQGPDIWVDSLLSARGPLTERSDKRVKFGCEANQVPVHGHILDNGWQCVASDLDTAPAWSGYVAEALVCGVGIDSITAWHAKR